MKTVRVLLKTDNTVSFPEAVVQQNQDGQITIHDGSYNILCEFRENEFKQWWYVDEELEMPQVSQTAGDTPIKSENPFLR